MNDKLPNRKLCKFVNVISDDRIFVSITDIDNPKKRMKLAHLDIDKMKNLLIRAERELKVNEVVVPASRIAHLLYNVDKEIREKSDGTYLRPTGIYSSTHNWVLRYLMSNGYVWYYLRGDVKLRHRLRILNPKGIRKRGIDKWI